MSEKSSQNNDNKYIYTHIYKPEFVETKITDKWEKERVENRIKIIEKFSKNNIVLDLGCGTGSYLQYVLPNCKIAIGIDFSETMLNEIPKKYGNKLPFNLNLLEADATKIPLKDGSIDFVFAFASLMYVENQVDLIEEISRVVKKDGMVCIELINPKSLGAFANFYFHRDHSWAKTFGLTVKDQKKILVKYGFEIVHHIGSQILPMYGTPRALRPLMPLLTPHWKKIMSISLKGKNIDEIISSSFLLSRYAMRHLYFLKKI